MTTVELRFLTTAMLLAKTAHKEENGERVFRAPSSAEIDEAVRVVDALFAQPSYAALAAQQLGEHIADMN